MLFEYNGVRKECETVLDVKKFHSMMVDQLILDGWCIDSVHNREIYFANGKNEKIYVSLLWGDNIGSFRVVDFNNKIIGDEILKIDFSIENGKITEKQEA